MTSVIAKAEGSTLGGFGMQAMTATCQVDRQSVFGGLNSMRSGVWPGSGVGGSTLARMGAAASAGRVRVAPR